MYLFRVVLFKLWFLVKFSFDDNGNERLRCNWSSSRLYAKYPMSRETNTNRTTTQVNELKKNSRKTFTRKISTLVQYSHLIGWNLCICREKWLLANNDSNPVCSDWCVHLTCYCYHSRNRSSRQETIHRRNCNFPTKLEDRIVDW